MDRVNLVDLALRDALVRTLAARSDVRMAILFGSQATGRAREGSDVDLVVDAPGTDLLSLARNLSLSLGREVDLVDVERLTIPLLIEVVRDGVLVHERDPGRHGAFRSHAIASLEIDGPWYARMRDAWLRRLAERRP